MQRRLPVFGEHGVRVGAVLEQPDRSVRRPTPVEDRVQGGRPVGGPRLIDVGAVREQRLQHGDIAGTRGQGEGDAVVRVRAGVEERCHERQRAHDA